MTDTIKARFGIGEIVQHNLFGYRGVIIDADPGFQRAEFGWIFKALWIQVIAILVHGSVHHAYASEMNLTKDETCDPIEHPELDYFFDDFKNGLYHRRQYSN